MIEATLHDGSQYCSCHNSFCCRAFGHGSIFIGIPQMERQREASRIEQQLKQQGATPTPSSSTTAPTSSSSPPPVLGKRPSCLSSDEAASQNQQRIAIESKFVSGSLRLQCARIDDLMLRSIVKKLIPAAHLFAALALWSGGRILCRV